MNQNVFCFRTYPFLFSDPIRTVVAYAPQVGVYYGTGYGPGYGPGSVQSPVGPTYSGERPSLIYTPGDQYVPGIVLHQNPSELEGGVLQGGPRSGGIGTASGAVGPGTMINGQVPVVTATAVQVVGGYPTPISMSQAQHWQLMSGPPPNSAPVGGSIAQPVQQPHALQAQHWQLMSGPDLTSNTNIAARTRLM